MRAPERLGPYVYRQSDTCFPLGGDSLALAAFASVRRGDRVCDLGCGAGALLLLLAARVSPLVLSGVEYCPEDAALAHQNLAENGLEGRFTPRSPRRVQNPPRRGLLPGGLQPALLQGGERRLRRARPDGGGLRPGGLVRRRRAAAEKRGTPRPRSPAERLCDLFAALRSAGLEPKRLRLLQHGLDCPPSAVLLEAVRQGRPGLEILPTLLSNRR